MGNKFEAALGTQLPRVPFVQRFSSVFSVRSVVDHDSRSERLQEGINIVAGLETQILNSYFVILPSYFPTISVTPRNSSFTHCFVDRPSDRFNSDEK